jgi:hypothetical protein
MRDDFEFWETCLEERRAAHMIDVGMGQDKIGKRRQGTPGLFDEIQNAGRGRSRSRVDKKRRGSHQQIHHAVLGGRETRSPHLIHSIRDVSRGSHRQRMRIPWE